MVPDLEPVAARGDGEVALWVTSYWPRIRIVLAGIQVEDGRRAIGDNVRIQGGDPLKRSTVARPSWFTSERRNTWRAVDTRIRTSSHVDR